MTSENLAAGGCRRRLITALAAAVCVILLASACWIFRAPILRGAANLWIISDKPVHADAIVVLGGEPQSRSTTAAGLYSAGYAPRVLVVSPGPTVSNKMGITQEDTEITRRILIAEGVPEAAISLLGKNVKNTREEAADLHEWANRNGAEKFLVVTGVFQSRRALWIFRKDFGGPDSVLIVPAMPLNYDATKWWQNEQGVIEFQNELMKYAYYRLKY